MKALSCVALQRMYSVDGAQIGDENIEYEVVVMGKCNYQVYFGWGLLYDRDVRNQCS